MTTPADDPAEMKSYADSIFEPWERILILSIALDDVPEGPSTEAMRAVLAAAIAVVRNLQGRTGRKAAFKMVERANTAIRELCAAPTDFVRTYAKARGLTIEESTRTLLAIAESRVSATDGYARRKKSRKERTA